MDISFKTGEFQQFIATKKFALTEIGIDVLAGTEVLFDGLKMQYNGMEYMIPKLRGVFKMGWLVPAEQYLAGGAGALPPPPVSAGVQVRRAAAGGNPLSPPERGTIPTTASDERVVVNSNQRAANVQARNVASRTASVDPRGLSGQKVRDQNGYAIVAEEQDGVPVRPVKTPAKSSTSMTDTGLYEENQRLKNLQFEPSAGNPKTEEERMAAMSEEDRASYLAHKEANAARLQSTKKGVATSHGRPVVGGVNGKTKGVTVSTGSTEVEYPQSDEAAKVTEMVVDGIKMTNTNGPGTLGKKSASSPPMEVTSKIDKDGTADARRKIARSICKDFPESYDFADHWKKRLARIRLDYETRPEIIRAIFAAESDDFKKVLLEEFPEVFAAA
jgi:hypothetical protein